MSKTRGRVFTILLTALLGAGMFLAFDASRHTEFRYDVSITQEVQAWDAPGLDGTLRFVSELTNFLPGVAIWTAVVAIFIWRGLRVEALVLLMAVVTFLGAETLGVLVDRPRPSPELVHVSQPLVGNGFPSGHVFAAVVFYGLLVAITLRRTRMIPLRLLAPAIGLSIVVLAAVARVNMGVHWPSDVLGGLLLGSAALGGLLWVYAGLSAGCLEFLGLEFHVTRRLSPKRNWAEISLWLRRSTVHLPNPGLPGQASCQRTTPAFDPRELYAGCVSLLRPGD